MEEAAARVRDMMCTRGAPMFPVRLVPETDGFHLRAPPAARAYVCVCVCQRESGDLQ